MVIDFMEKDGIIKTRQKRSQMKRTTHKELISIITAIDPRIPIVVQGIKGLGWQRLVKNLSISKGLPPVDFFNPFGGDPNDRCDLPFKGPADWKKRIFRDGFCPAHYKVILRFDEMPLNFQSMAIDYCKNLKPCFQKIIFMVEDERKLLPFFRTGLILRGKAGNSHKQGNASVL